MIVEVGRGDDRAAFSDAPSTGEGGGGGQMEAGRLDAGCRGCCSAHYLGKEKRGTSASGGGRLIGKRVNRIPRESASDTINGRPDPVVSPFRGHRAVGNSDRVLFLLFFFLIANRSNL